MAKMKDLNQRQKIWFYSLFGIVFFIVGINFLYYYVDFPFYVVTALLLLLTVYLITFLLFTDNGAVLLKHNNQKYQNLKWQTAKISELKKKIIWLLEDQELFLNNQLKLSDLSKQLGVSSHIVSMVINEAQKKSFPEYVNTLRVQRAKKNLLEEADKKIIAIALESGFSSLSTFNRVFKKHAKINPSEYRAKYVGK